MSIGIEVIKNAIDQRKARIERRHDSVVESRLELKADEDWIELNRIELVELQETLKRLEKK